MKKDQWKGQKGEGSYEGSADYDERTKRFLENEDVEKEARKAREAIDGPEGDELREAEAEGKSRAREEDPELGATPHSNR